MNRRLLLLFVISLILLSITIVYFVTIYNRQSFDNFEPLIHFEKDYIGLTSDKSITPGKIFTVNLTINSDADKELSIPFSLRLTIVRNGSSQKVGPEEAGVTYNIEPNLVILEPYGSNSSLLTVELSKDAIVGDYHLFADNANWRESHVGGAIFMFFVKNE